MKWSGQRSTGPACSSLVFPIPGLLRMSFFAKPVPSYARHASVPAFAVDQARQGVAASVAADGFEHEFNRRFWRRHAGVVRREQNSRMVPEWMAGGQRLGFGYIENRRRQNAAVERVDQIVRDQVSTAPDIDQLGAARQRF